MSPEGLLDLTGRVAIVTGAGQNVGRTTALRLAEHGAAVAVNDLFEDRAEAVAKEIEALGGTAAPVVADVADRAAVGEMVAEVRKRLGIPTILVNNAGIPPEMPGAMTEFVRSDPDSWDPWIRVNLYGTLNCTHAVLPGMLESCWGRIVGVISDAARVGEPRMAAYAAGKAAIAGFVRAIAKEVGEHGVTANCIALGGIRTPAIESMLTPEQEERVLRRYTIRRLGTPDDAAAAILFFVSPTAEWITGQVLPVNGGYSVTQ